MGTTESQNQTQTKPKRIASLFAGGENRVFHSLMHHINVDTLRICFDGLDGKKAVGVDSVSKEQYGTNLQSNLEDLVRRMRSMSYRPGPVREVLIPKEGKQKATRALGISNFEDKIVQSKLHEMLESIYEP